MEYSIEGITLRRPLATDGAALWRLVQQCPPLDPNSRYCNLLQCSHFAATSVAARKGNALVGFISAYLVPERPDTLFVWQVAVADQARGQGLATRMLRHILARPACAATRRLETTITESNRASWALFEGLAASLGATSSVHPLFDRREHFDGAHDSELLLALEDLPHPAPAATRD